MCVSLKRDSVKYTRTHIYVRNTAGILLKCIVNGLISLSSSKHLL